jgi:Uma2 family endonuclease
VTERSGKLSNAVADNSHVAVQYSLPDSLPEWELPEVPVPESPEHDEVADHLRALLVAWLARAGRPGAVRRNLAIRWVRQNPKIGVDPDVCWIETLPPGWTEGEIDSLRLWMPGHRVPPLAIEIVSRHHPYKDYGKVQDKYAVVGVGELWVYDPRRFGPRSLGGPVLLQVWNRNPAGVLVRRHFGDGPARSELLDAWLVPEEANHLVIADDRQGARRWQTGQEEATARADKLEAEIRRLRAKRS